jgi:hypothetical protein
MTLTEITFEEIEALRAFHWRATPARRLTRESEAVRFIEDQGFVLLMPIHGAELPSVHGATAGDWGTWWDWKQTLPERKACYYAKILRRRGTFISWDWFPRFYAAYADARPYWRQYREGLLSGDEKRILDLLESQGPMMTRELRLAFGPRSKENTRRVKSIIVDLQTRFLITAAGGDTAGWSHHRWDLVERWVGAACLHQAAQLSQTEARTAIVRKLVGNLFMTTPADIAWLLGWELRAVKELVGRLMEEHAIRLAHVPELDGEVIVPDPWPSRKRPSPRGTKR